MLTKQCTNASDTIWGEQNLNTYTWAYLDGLKIQCPMPCKELPESARYV